MRKKVSQTRREEMAVVEHNHTNGTSIAVPRPLLLDDLRQLGKSRVASWLVVLVVACLMCN
jgi:hypothetical protein